MLNLKTLTGKNLARWVLFVISIGLLSAQAADVRLSAVAEQKGINKVMNLIEDVSLKQSDKNTNQSLSELLELKSELYNTPVRSSQRTAQSQAPAKLPPARPLRSY